MRHLTLLLMGTLCLPVSALATDYGTYRPGNSYMKIPAQNPDQCISYCSGDAQCKGWNFVKLNPAQSICEFNARDAAPIASAISISGRSSTAGSNFVRQSTPSLVQTGGSVTRVGQISSPQTKPPSSSPSRHVLRHSVPTLDPRHQIANYRSRLHSIATPRGGTALSQQTPQQAISNARPKFSPHLDALPPRREIDPTVAHKYAKRSAYKPMLDTRPIVSQSAPISDAPTDDRPGIAAPKVSAEDLPTIPRLSQMPMNKPRPSINSALAGGPVAGTLPASSSLYGSLYDDVKRPRSLSADDIPVDPDAPISTVISVPVENPEMSTF